MPVGLEFFPGLVVVVFSVADVVFVVVLGLVVGAVVFYVGQKILEQKIEINVGV